MIRLTAKPLDAYGRDEFTVTVDGRLVALTHNAALAADFLRELGVANPVRLVEQARKRGSAEAGPPSDQRETWESLIARRDELRGIRGQRIGGEPADEAEHFYTCEHCGQSVDRRDLFSVLHHEQAEHKPLTRSC
jgi:hypothetical protein